VVKQYTFVDYATQAYAALVGLLILLFHNGTVARWPWLLAAHATILVAVHVLIQAPGRLSRAAPALYGTVDFLRHFYPVLLFIWFFGETGWLNRMFFKDYLDVTVIRWDQALFGYQPSVLFMQKLPYLAVSEVLYAAYFSYYLMIGGVGIALFIRDRGQFFHYVSVVSFVFYVCYLLYIILPIIGPPIFYREISGYTLPEDIRQLVAATPYPEAVRNGIFFRLMAWIYRVFEAPGAAFPSSHVAIALVTVFFSFRYLRRIRYVHAVVVVLLCLATVYGRYHYVVDVLSGVVTAALLIPIANRLYFKSTAPVNPSPSHKFDTVCKSGPQSPRGHGTS
jgi:membrane-associated phospholipid phosphatase